MMRFVYLFILIVNCASADAQFTYFNLITGEQGDLSSEVCANVEAVTDGYVVWGAEIDDNILKHFIRKYNLDGQIVNENILVHQNQYVLSGIVNSFKWNPYIQKFVYIHGTNFNDGTTKGYLIEFDENLDTVFTKHYFQYPPYTYPFIFEVESDGYIVTGEYGGIMNSNGTFLMKLDFEGNIIWSEILQQEVYQHIYRNWQIIKIDGGYLITGGGKTPDSGNEPFGLITKVDNTGHIISELTYQDDEALRVGHFGELRLMNNEILLSISISYELLDPNGNPNIFWRKFRLLKYNVEDEDFYWQQDYFGDYEMIMGSAGDKIATSDGGAVILGTRQGEYFDYYSWILKIDSSGNQEWFHEYTFQTCDNCTNILYDIELAPDGGYIAAGQFANYDIDPRNATWLLKIDACGDLEWQGCAPVGVMEKEPNQFSVYPNPGSGRFTIEASENSQIVSWAVYNLSGQKVAQGSASHFGQSMQINLNLSSGLYALELVQSDGKRENHKIQIVR